MQKDNKNNLPIKKLSELPSKARIGEAKKRIVDGYYKSDDVIDDIIEKVVNSLNKPP